MQFNNEDIEADNLGVEIKIKEEDNKNDDFNQIKVKTNKVKRRKSSIISEKERKIIAKIRQDSIDSQKKAIKTLIIVSIICILFMIGELVGGIIAKSLAIQSDALHMFSDFSGFAISMISIVISKRKPNDKLTFGYHRAEVVGALLSILLIWVLTGVLVYEAVNKIIYKNYEVNGMIMFIVAIVGLVCNIVMGHILHKSVKYDINLNRVEIMQDMIMALKRRKIVKMISLMRRTKKIILVQRTLVI